MQFTKFSRADLNDAIELVKANAGTQDEHLHNTIVSALHVAHDEKDLEPLSQILRVLPKSTHRTHLLVYIKEHAPVKWSKKGEVFRLKKLKNQNPWLLSEAEKVPFWNFEKAPAPRPAFDVNKFIARCEKTLQEAKDNGELHPHVQYDLRIGIGGLAHKFAPKETATLEGSLTEGLRASA